MLFLQTIFFFVYLIKKLKSLKNFMLTFKIDNNVSRNQKNKGKIIKINQKSTPPPKNIPIKTSINRKKNNKILSNTKKFINNKFHDKNKLKYKDYAILNASNTKNEINSKNAILISNNFVSNINIKTPDIKKNNFGKEINFRKDNNNEKIYMKSKFIKKGKYNIKKK